MTPALTEFTTLVGEIEIDADFVAYAAQLRPRLGGFLRWEAIGDAQPLVQNFLNAKESRVEGLYGPLLVRLLAAFERYVRKLIMWAVDEYGSASHYDQLPSILANRNRSLTGKMLSAIELPDHLVVDIDALIENLASCKQGSSQPFRLNASVFCAGLASVNPVNLERAFESLDITSWWDAVGANQPLSKMLGTKGARLTGERASALLKDLSRQRNQLAHGGDGNVSIAESRLREAISFISLFSEALDDIVQSRLRTFQKG